jgi:ribosomal protein S18 acetylase RimI-like enzyme
MDAVIREARPEDFEEVFALVLELRKHFGDGDKPLDKNKVREYYDLFSASEDHNVYVAEAGGDVVGVMTLSMLTSLYEDQPYIVVDELIVAGDSRGAGVGRGFLDEAFRLARERGCCEVSLDTTPDNENAIRFYRAYGFDQESILFEKELGGGED